MSLFEVVTNWVEGHTRGRDEDRYGFDNHDAAKDYANERLGDADTAKVVIVNKDTGEETEWKGDAPTEVPPPDPTQSGELPPGSAASDTSGDDSKATADQLNAEEAAANPTGDNPPPSFDPSPTPTPMPGDANPKTPPTNT